MTQKFVTVFGEDPSAVSEPIPVSVVPTALQVVDQKGTVVFSVDTAADLAEVTSNTQAMNAELTTMARASVGKDDPFEPVPEHPIPDAKDHYQGLLYRWKLTVEMHNNEFPDDPWCVQELQDVPDDPISVAQTQVTG
jgi:hypothetical protein